MDVPKLRFRSYQDDWITKKIGMVCTFSKGKELSKEDLSEEGKSCILYGELYTKYDAVIDEVYSKTTKDSKSLVTANKYDLLIPSSGESAIDIACASSLDVDSILIGGDLNILTPNADVHGHFLSYQINSTRKKELSTFAQGATVTHLYADGIKKLECHFPSFEEQEQVANFIYQFDKKIRLQQEKIDLLKEQKKGFMQKIFSQELRFKDNNGCSFPNWTNLSMNEIVKMNLREIPKPTESYVRLGLRSHAKGTFHETIENPEEVEMDKLYVVHEGDLVINITFAWEQALAIAKKSDHGKLVSHRFPTYVFESGHYNLFYRYYLTTKLFKYHLKNASPGGAGRNRVLNRSDFLKIEMKCPSYNEQVKIADFLSNLDKRINVEEVKLENLNKQKKGFMHQMFI